MKRFICSILTTLFLISQTALAADVTTFRWGWPAAPLLATGQTTPYHADDDGTLELGIAHRYTILTTGQYAGNVTVTINSKNYDFLNACVQDEKTGLMLARTVPQSGIGPAADGKLFWEQYILAAETCTCAAGAKTITADAATPFDADALCVGRIFTILGSAAGNNGTFTVTNITTSVITVSETVVDEASIALDFASVDDRIWDLKDQANAGSGLAGYTDWRIPNLRELLSIIDWGQNDPAIDGTVFPSTPSVSHWTSTNVEVYSGTTAWSVTFLRGSSVYVNQLKKTLKLNVRLVRN